jgi:predicted deacylase
LRIKHPNIETKFIFSGSGAYVSANHYFFKYIPKTPLSRYVLKQSLKGTMMYKFGSGDLKLMLVSGVHGDEIPPQIASLFLMEKLVNSYLNGTIYVIPFTAPQSTMNNSRWFNGVDLNRSSTVIDSLTYLILKKAKELKVDSIADFHSTSLNSNPGKEGIFCSLKPINKSCKIGKHISDKVGSEIISYETAGSAFKGTLEDESNLSEIPAVTCEVLSAKGYAEKKTYLKSLEQMEAYLSYYSLKI